MTPVSPGELGPMHVPRAARTMNELLALHRSGIHHIDA
jgi:hypothetical protein